MRRLVACLLLLILPYVAVLRAVGPTLGQRGAILHTAGVAAVPLTGVADGSFVIVAALMYGADIDQSFAVTSTPANTWVDNAVNSGVTTGSNDNRRCVIAYSASVTTTAGALTTTITSSNGTVNFFNHSVEVLNPGSGLVAATVTAANSVAESADATSHNAAAGLTVAADAFVYHGAVGNTTLGALTAISSPVAFTSLAADFATTHAIAQYYNGGTGISADNLAWTSGSSRTAASCVLAVVASSGAVAARSRLTTVGVGKR